MRIFTVAATGLVAPAVKAGHRMVFLVGKAADRHAQQLARMKLQVWGDHVQKTAGTQKLGPSGEGTPSIQPFVVYEPGFNAIETGVAVPRTDAAIPEPTGAVLFLVGLAIAATRMRRCG